jgi:hypothetical protein
MGTRPELPKVVEWNNKVNGMAHSPAQKIAVQKVDHRKARPAPKKKARQASIDLDAAMAACHGY